ncbi:MAG: adenylate kinase [Bacilli bacterium]|nr:adenylate kinase [Bacilli bacterium]
MIYMITGASHTGKTLLAQKLLEKYKYPYLSIDHLKMGLIRSGNTNLTALSNDEELTSYLWPIVANIIKTAIENKQNLIVEGCYVPFDYNKYFENNYLKEIKYCCLIMTEHYILNHYQDIIRYENVIEKRINDDISIDCLIKDNEYNFKNVQKNKLDYILINDDYLKDINKYDI